MSWRTVSRWWRYWRRRIFGMPLPKDECPVCKGASGHFPGYQSEASRAAYGKHRYLCVQCAYGLLFAGLNVITAPKWGPQKEKA